MEKTAILGVILAIALALILVIALTPGSLTSFSILPQQIDTEDANLHAWTKAICTENNFCQDYIIECQGEKPIKLSPITGAAVQFDNSWQDPRGIEQRERLC